MNKIEKSKVRALAACKLWAGHQRIVCSLVYSLDNNLKQVLTPKQRWLLDSLVYAYRGQLFDSSDVTVPEHKPCLEDYERPSKRRGQQLSLL